MHNQRAVRNCVLEAESRARDARAEEHDAQHGRQQVEQEPRLGRAFPATRGAVRREHDEPQHEHAEPAAVQQPRGGLSLSLDLHLLVPQLSLTLTVTAYSTGALPRTERERPRGPVYPVLLLVLFGHAVHPVVVLLLLHDQVVVLRARRPRLHAEEERHGAQRHDAEQRVAHDPRVPAGGQAHVPLDEADGGADGGQRVVDAGLGLTVGRVLQCREAKHQQEGRGHQRQVAQVPDRGHHQRVGGVAELAGHAHAGGAQGHPVVIPYAPEEIQDTYSKIAALKAQYIKVSAELLEAVKEVEKRQEPRQGDKVADAGCRH
ncbi:hypothetical protein ON010_g9323 [Phytophthora cinnamomi]|nr:hypothetical protein ON010_g9323 [Phytophthora cinnamomi]